MAMGPERSKPPLHNFSLPCLKWGTQRLLRCVNSDSNSPSSIDRRSSKFDAPQMNQNDPNRVPKRKNDDNIEAVREKIMGDLRVAAKKLKVSIFDDGGDDAANARPWNLRTRRAACKAPVPPPPPPPAVEEERGNFEVGCSSPSPPAKEKKKMVNERPKFCVPLSKEEVEQDFLALLGTRPPRRPKKRPRVVQKQLNTLFPGLWLTEVTAELYKVPDDPE